MRYEAPGFGTGELWLDGRCVVWSELPRPRGERAPNGPQGIPEIPEDTVPRGVSHVVDDFVPDLVRVLEAFFRGEAVDLGDVDVDLEWATAFERKLTAALRAVPRGEVVTYGDLAERAGRPRAARAAGTFCARNRLAPFVPCHRVVSAAGLGGYGALGVEYKRRLLELEGAVL